MSRGTPTHSNNAGGSSQNTPMVAPHMTTTSPTPSPRRAHFPLAPSHAGPASPRLGSRIVPQRMPSDSSDREGSPGIDSPSSRRTTLVMGFSPGSTNSPLPSVAENGRADSPSPRPLITTITSPLARRPSQFTTPVEQNFPPSLPFGSPGRSPRNLNPDLPPRSRRNSAAPVSISIRSSDRSATPRGSRAGLPKSGRDSGNGTPGGTSQTVTPRGEGSSNGPGKRPVLVQMNSGLTRREDSWTPKYDHEEREEEWNPAGGMLLHDDDEHQGRSWTSLDEEDEAGKKNILRPGDVFGEGLMFQGEVITAAIGRMHGHDIDHPLRRGGSEIGMARRNGPVGVGPTAGRERQRTSYEVVRVAGEGSFAQVYYIRERNGKQREYALKTVARPDLSEVQYEDQLFEARVHLSLPIHTNIVTLHETLQTSKWIFFLLEWCPGDDLFYWLENNKVRHTQGSNNHHQQHSVSSNESSGPNNLLSSSKYSSSTIPFSPGAMFSGLAAQHPGASSLQSTMGSPFNTLSPGSHAYGASPAASMIFSHNNQHSAYMLPTHLSQTPPTPSLLSAFSANTLLRADRLRLIASMFSQMCEAVAVCHEAGISHRDIKPENFICCDSIDLETVAENEARALGISNGNRGDSVQAKRKVIVKLTDFGLATTAEDCDDMSCGSKPYMSYECRNGHVAPSYLPAPSDVWSLGVVLLNMMFHRACWNEATEDNHKFSQYMRDRRGYLMNHFPGIGNQVATFLADHVLCLDVGDRVSARDFGKWIRNLPEMVAGRSAVREMKTAVKEMRSSNGEQGLFQKSPIVRQGSRKTKTSTSALTTTAPSPPTSFQGLSSLPPPIHLAYGEQPVPDLAHTAEPTPTTGANTTPAESTDMTSPGSSELNSPSEGPTNEQDEQSQSLASQQKRRKRGVRKGKAAQAAIAAENRQPTQPEREALLSELANASQSLARDLSKTHISRVDTASPEQFPPLGTSPAQIAQAKRSKWRGMLSFSATADNPELAALARRVAERDAGGQGVKGGFGNWSAPAKMQDDHRGHLASRPGFKQTNTMSTSGVASQLSSFGGFGAMSSATSSGIEEEPEETKAKPRPPVLAPEIQTKEKQSTAEVKEAKETEDARLKKAVEAAAALTTNMGMMGSFGQRPQNIPRHGPLHGQSMTNGIVTPAVKPVITKSAGPRAAPVPIVKSPPPVQQTPGGRTITTPTLKSSATLTKTTVGSATSSNNIGSSLPSLSASLASSANSKAFPPSQNAASSSTPLSSQVPPVPVERHGKVKGGQMRFFDKLMRGVQSSNKKE